MGLAGGNTNLRHCLFELKFEESDQSILIVQLHQHQGYVLERVFGEGKRFRGFCVSVGVHVYVCVHVCVCVCVCDRRCIGVCMFHKFAWEKIGKLALYYINVYFP